MDKLAWKRGAHENRRSSRARYEYEKKVRFTQDQFQRIKETSDAMGLSEEEFIRQRVDAGLLADNIKPVIQAEIAMAIDNVAPGLTRMISKMQQLLGQHGINIPSHDDPPAPTSDVDAMKIIVITSQAMQHIKAELCFHAGLHPYKLDGSASDHGKIKALARDKRHKKAFSDYLYAATCLALCLDTDVGRSLLAFGDDTPSYQDAEFQMLFLFGTFLAGGAQDLSEVSEFYEAMGKILVLKASPELS